MTALIVDRQTYTSAPGLRDFPIADNVIVYEGSLVSVDTSGYARPARVSTTDVCVGVAFQRVDNTLVGHVAGGKNVHVRDNDIAYFNSGASADLITNVSVGLPCYVIDDNTVGLTNGSSTRVAAGVIYWVNENGQVGVKFTK